MFSILQFSILHSMAVVRRAVELGRVARKSAGLRVRQPLSRILVAVGSPEERAALLRHQNDVLDELNVKTLEVLDSSAGLLRYQLKPNLRLLGPRLGKRLPALRAVLDGLDEERASVLARAVEHGQPVTLSVGEEVITLAPEEMLIEIRAARRLCGGAGWRHTGGTRHDHGRGAAARRTRAGSCTCGSGGTQGRRVDVVRSDHALPERG